MCGIVAALDFEGRPVNNMVLQQYDEQRHRGQEGFGYFDGKMNHIVKATTENKILKWLVKHDSHMIIFHHRFPTSTVNVKRAAHPFSTKGYFGDTQYILVHNGVIRNADELFCAHQELGIDYQSMLTDLTYNDSEGLLWDFALYIEGKQEKMNAIGDMAFICAKLVKGKIERLYFYRNIGRPLKFLRAKEGIMLSSEGDGEIVPFDTLHNWNYKLKRLTKTKLSVPERKPYVYQGGGNYTPSGNFQRQSTIPYTDPFDDPSDYSRDYWGNYPSSYETVSRTVTDDTRYEEYWEKKKQDQKKTGERLGEYLRSRYPQFYHNGAPIVDRADKSQLTDYEQSESGIYVPKYERKQKELLLLERKHDTPSDDEIVTCMMDYLAAVSGHFEQAHWAIEVDYEDLENKPQTATVIREKVLLDLALQRLDNDPEYVNEESVSSFWRSIWTQQQLASA